MKINYQTIMRNLIKYFALFIFCIFASNTLAQSEFSIGAGGGSTHFYGSISSDKNIGYQMQVDGRYKFNSTFSTGLSFQYATLKSSRLTDAGSVGSYFDTNTKNVNVHLQMNVLSLLPEPRTLTKLRVALDVGPGLMFYDDIAFVRNSNGDFEYDLTHKGEGGNGTAYKMHFGGEVGYELTDKLEVFGSILGNYIFSSDVDGYSVYNNGNSNSSNDFYYTTTVGLKYDVWSGDHQSKVGTRTKKVDTGVKKVKKANISNKKGKLKTRISNWKARKNTRNTVKNNRQKDIRTKGNYVR